jgi:hypothetical protein
VATPHPIRPQHALVATVLRHRRLGRRRNPHHRTIDGSSLSWLGRHHRHGHMCDPNSSAAGSARGGPSPFGLHTGHTYSAHLGRMPNLSPYGTLR